jgi:hypothetical protein
MIVTTEPDGVTSEDNYGGYSVSPFNATSPPSDVAAPLCAFILFCHLLLPFQGARCSEDMMRIPGRRVLLKDD